MFLSDVSLEFPRCIMWWRSGGRSLPVVTPAKFPESSSVDWRRSWNQSALSGSCIMGFFQFFGEGFLQVDLWKGACWYPVSRYPVCIRHDVTGNALKAGRSKSGLFREGNTDNECTSPASTFWQTSLSGWARACFVFSRIFLSPVLRGRDGGCLRHQPMYVEERGHYLYRSHGGAQSKSS